MNFEIRKMKEEDLDQIEKIEKIVFPFGGWQKHQYQYEITTNPVSLPYVLTDGENIIGYYSIWQMFDYMTIATIAVNPDFQGQGFGNVLMMDIIQRSKSLNMKSIDLEVRVSNKTAIRLYEKFGFKHSHIRKGYYTNGEDAYFMIKNLRSDQDEFNFSN
ncbi:MAG: ribosomal-protein-alanine N-acetyltransferase [Erysipelotrichaceae bacterium]|nr:ribosomal-protein-alanine N-acetyltransferase [Erysipelotrichaceae bacterium]